MLETIKAINDSDYRFYITCSGGGQSFLPYFLSIPGGSASVIGGQTPYHKHEIDSIIGKQKHYCTERVAIEYAKYSYIKTRNVSAKSEVYSIGIGVTASLATVNERVGRKHKVFMAFHNKNYTLVYSYEFSEGCDRDTEETFIKNKILDILGKLIKFPTKPSWIDMSAFDNNHKIMSLARYYQLYDNEYNETSEDNEYDEPSEDTIVFYSGSWNPFHDGHAALSRIAEEVSGEQVIYELCIDNADKGIIDYFEVERRLSQSRLKMVLVSFAPTFLEKATLLSKIYNNIIFVVGSDTWNRIQDEKYAGPIQLLYDEFVRMNVKFMVFKRDTAQIITGSILDKLMIHDERIDSFSNNLSSTQLRETK